MNENLSAFVDGESSSRETAAVMRQLGRDAAARDSLNRQLWLRETLRGESLDLDLGFADRLAARIDAEDQVSAKVIDLPARAARLRKHWLGPMTGFATAASIVTAVVLLTNAGQQSGQNDGVSATQLAANDQPNQQPFPSVNTAAVPTVSASGADGNLRRVAASSSGQSRGVGSNWAVSDPAVEDRLNGYLLEHNGLARGYGLSSATPSFVRVATYGQGSAR